MHTSFGKFQANKKRGKRKRVGEPRAECRHRNKYRESELELETALIAGRFGNINWLINLPKIELNELSWLPVRQMRASMFSPFCLWRGGLQKLPSAHAGGSLFCSLDFKRFPSGLAVFFYAFYDFSRFFFHFYFSFIYFHIPYGLAV